MMIFDEMSNFLFPPSGWARTNRNSLAQFMRTRARALWPDGNGTYRGPRTDAATRKVYGGGKSYRRAKIKARRAARQQTKESP